MCVLATIPHKSGPRPRTAACTWRRKWARPSNGRTNERTNARNPKRIRNGRRDSDISQTSAITCRATNCFPVPLLLEHQCQTRFLSRPLYTLRRVMFSGLLGRAPTSRHGGPRGPPVRAPIPLLLFLSLVSHGRCHACNSFSRSGSFRCLLCDAKKSAAKQKFEFLTSQQTVV